MIYVILITTHSYTQPTELIVNNFYLQRLKYNYRSVLELFLKCDKSSYIHCKQRALYKLFGKVLPNYELKAIYNEQKLSLIPESGLCVSFSGAYDFNVGGEGGGWGMKMSPQCAPRINYASKKTHQNNCIYAL